MILSADFHHAGNPNNATKMTVEYETERTPPPASTNPNVYIAIAKDGTNDGMIVGLTDSQVESLIATLGLYLQRVRGS